MADRYGGGGLSATAGAGILAVGSVLGSGVGSGVVTTGSAVGTAIGSGLATGAAVGSGVATVAVIGSGVGAMVSTDVGAGIASAAGLVVADAPAMTQSCPVKPSTHAYNTIVCSHVPQPCRSGVTAYVQQN